MITMLYSFDWLFVDQFVSPFFFVFQNIDHPAVVNLERMFETPERVSFYLTLIL